MLGYETRRRECRSGSEQYFLASVLRCEDILSKRKQTRLNSAFADGLDT